MMNNMFLRQFFIFAAVLSYCCFAFAGDWEQWRGPNGNGSTDDKGLPSSFENVLWEYSIGGVGSGTPVISKGKVFFSSEDDDSDGLFGICLDAKTGKEVFRKKLSDSAGRKIPRGGNMAASSAVCDGKRVFFLFDNGIFTCLDYNGKQLWSRNLEKDFGFISVKFGCGTTPLYYDGRLYVYIQRRPQAYLKPVNIEPYDSFLLAVDPSTGKTIYKHVRKADAEGETYDAYTSPVAFEHKGRKEILLLGANYFTGHDPETGKELWRFDYNPERERLWRVIPSPLVADDLLVFVQPRSNKSFALKAGGKGILDEDDIAWTFDGPTSDTPTPLFYNGDVYYFDGSRKKILNRVDGKTGKLKWTGCLTGKGPYYASFTAGDDKMYCISDAGEAVIVASGGDQMEILAKRDFGGRPVKSSIAIADGKLFIRTAEKLYCIPLRVVNAHE